MLGEQRPEDGYPVPKPCTREGCRSYGQPHDGCAGHPGARSRNHGQPCPNPRVKGTVVCRYHGGSAPAVAAAGAKRMEAAAARRIAANAVKTLGLARDISPTQALLDELRWTAGHVEWLRGQVQVLTPTELTWGKTETVDKQATEFGGVDTTEAAGPSVWYQLYLEERKHLLKVAAACHAANIDERRVQLAERQGLLVAETMKRVLAAAFEVVVSTLRAHGVADVEIVEALHVVWQSFLAERVPVELRAMGEVEARSIEHAQEIVDEERGR